MKAIGVDLVENERIARLVQKAGSRFLQRVYTSQEIAYCRGRIPSLAARWAAKEAVSKAFGTGIGDIRFTDIEVVCDVHGKPGIILHGNAQSLAQTLGFEQIALSLSHSKTQAVAFVVVT